MNYLTQDDGASPASPHYEEKEIIELHSCSMCGHTYERDNLKHSEMDSEWYCTVFDGGCWKIRAEEHKSQCKEFGYAITDFK